MTIQTVSPEVLEAFRSGLGTQFVHVDDESVSEAQQATFESNTRVAAVVRPGTTDEVQTCVRIANQYGVPIYPISRGRNWGLGSKLPTRSGSIVLDLGRMNSIVEFDEELGYVTVEPGVTFAQVANYLRKRHSTYFLSAIGGPSDSSVLGNFLERGTGIGPMGERPANACDIHVVLGRGDVVRTGFGQYPESKLAALHRWGVGPSLDGLFCQSNFGIVVRATFWLSKYPNEFQSFMAVANSEWQFSQSLISCRELIDQRVVAPYSVFFWNHVKVAAAQNRHPHPDSDAAIDWNRLLRGQSRILRDAKWVIVGGLYAGSRQVAAAQRRAVRKSLSRCTTARRFLNRRTVAVAKAANRVCGWMGRRPLIDQEILKGLYEQSPMLGYFSDAALKSVYWRKTMSTPESIEPNRDRCGVQWICHEVPYRASDIQQAVRMVEAICEEFGFEPNLALPIVSTRYVRLLFALLYDLQRAGEDDRATQCRDAAARGLNTAGYTSFRLGIQTMESFPNRYDADLRLHRDLKSLLDPNGIIAPGRYEGTNC